MARDPSPADYARDLMLQRKEKDYYFRTEPESPIPPELRTRLPGLSYFPPDLKYRLRVRLTRLPNPEPVTLATSKGIPRPMVRRGYFEFEMDGVGQRLYAYQAVSPPGHRHEDVSLFVPFRDATSGEESYGAARYLDLEESPSGEYVLDFNLAYNPYCAYSDDYVCPFPPQENWLTVPIRAGEKRLPLH